MKKIVQLIVAVSLLLVIVDRPGLNACEVKVNVLPALETTAGSTPVLHNDSKESYGRYPFAERLLIK